jgi:hypothetical protein
MSFRGRKSMLILFFQSLLRILNLFQDEIIIGTAPGTKGISDYGVHLREGDQGDFIGQAWTKALLDRKER